MFWCLLVYGAPRAVWCVRGSLTQRRKCSAAEMVGTMSLAFFGSDATQPSRGKAAPPQLPGRRPTMSHAQSRSAAIYSLQNMLACSNLPSPASPTGPTDVKLQSRMQAPPSTLNGCKETNVSRTCHDAVAVATRLRPGRSAWSRRRCPSRSACLCSSVSRSRLSGAFLGDGAACADHLTTARATTRNRNLAPCRHFGPQPSGVPPAPPCEHSTPVPVQLTRHGHVREPFHACVLQGRILDVARGRLRNAIGRESSSSTLGTSGLAVSRFRHSSLNQSFFPRPPHRPPHRWGAAVRRCTPD